jgi:hypothetical protein
VPKGTPSRLERRAKELGITPDELLARRQARKARQDAKRQQQPRINNRHQLTKEQQTLSELYAEDYTTFDALRKAMIRNGVVEHRVSAYDVIQRAIDDTVTDYMLMRQRIEKDSNGNIAEAIDHPLYPSMEKAREAMVRYSTFAMQYDIQLRQLKINEARVGILASTLRNVLVGLGLNHDQIQKVPQLLIEQLKSGEKNPRQTKLDAVKAEAIAEILANDSEVEILDATSEDVS